MTFVLDRRTLLVISDYYSNYIEVARDTSITSRSFIKELKAVFARFGIPDVVVTDNGPQFSPARPQKESERARHNISWGADAEPCCQFQRASRSPVMTLKVILVH